MTDFSVVICTFNGANKLPNVLERLKSQINTDDMRWEVVVIDNNSIDDTATLVRQYQQSWPADIPLRYCFEPQQGLAYARRCAIRNVTSPLIGFLDDDNWPQKTWVYEAWRFGCSHPKAGAYGSAVLPLYDVPPPNGFRRIAPLLAIVDRGNSAFIYAKRPGVLPVGAGMVVRRQAWLAHVPDSPWLAGVANTSLKTKGEDVETLSYIRDGGWQVWHNPAMTIHHHIPASRVERAYLLKLCRSVGLNRFPLRMVRYRSWQRPLVLPLYVVSDLRKLLIYLLRHYRSLPHDVVCACEVALLSSSLVSPFYHGFSHLPLADKRRLLTLTPQKQSPGQ